MSVIERTYTYEDMRLVSMFARLEGAPATVEEIIRDLEAKGKLSSATTTRGAVQAERERIVALLQEAASEWPDPSKTRQALLSVAIDVALSDTDGERSDPSPSSDLPKEDR